MLIETRSLNWFAKENCKVSLQRRSGGNCSHDSGSNWRQTQRERALPGAPLLPIHVSNVIWRKEKQTEWEV